MQEGGDQHIPASLHSLVPARGNIALLDERGLPISGTIRPQTMDRVMDFFVLIFKCLNFAICEMKF